jgi:hypothetical protein
MLSKGKKKALIERICESDLLMRNCLLVDIPILAEVMTVGASSVAGKNSGVSSHISNDLKIKRIAI